MSSEIINTKRGTSLLKLVGANTYVFTVNNFSVNTSTEIVSSVSIRGVAWSTNGYITIARGSGSNVILELHNSGRFNFSEMGYALNEESTGNVAVTIVTGGSCVLELTKTATYDPPLT